MDIANTLKEFRLQHGLEQDDLARLLETTQQTVSNWENGTAPRASALQRINHVLANYKAGEALSPPPRRVLNAAVNEIHGIKIRSPQESRQWVGEALGLVAGPSKIPTSPRRQMEEQLLCLLPDYLGTTYNSVFEHHGLRSRVDFLFNDVACNLTIPMLPSEPKRYGFHLYRVVEMHAMRLMTLRSIHRLRGFERKIYALVAIIPQETLQQLNPTQAMALASLHDIRLILVSSVEQGAQAIESLVEEAKPSPEEDFLDDKDRPW